MSSFRVEYNEYKLCDEYQRFGSLWYKLPVSSQVAIYNKLAVKQNYPIIWENNEDNIANVAELKGIEPNRIIIFRSNYSDKWFVEDLKYGHYQGISESEYDEDSLDFLVRLWIEYLKEIFANVDSWKEYIDYNRVFDNNSSLELAYAKACFKRDLLIDLLPNDEHKTYRMEDFYIENLYHDAHEDFVDIETIESMNRYYKLLNKFRWADKGALRFYAFNAHKFNSKSYSYDNFSYFKAHYKSIRRISRYERLSRELPFVRYEVEADDMSDI